MIDYPVSADLLEASEAAWLAASDAYEASKYVVELATEHCDDVREENKRKLRGPRPQAISSQDEIEADRQLADAVAVEVETHDLFLAALADYQELRDVYWAAFMPRVAA